MQKPTNFQRAVELLRRQRYDAAAEYIEWLDTQVDDG
jgi:hypothetical protein